MDIIPINLSEIKQSADDFSWQAPEYIYMPKTVNWYIGFVILFVIFFAIGILQKNLLFGAIIIISFIVLLLWSRRQPQLLTFTIDDRGLKMGKQFLHFKNILAFCLRQEENLLLFQKKSFMNQEIIISLTRNIDVERLREFLLKKLPQKEISISFFDSLARVFKF